MKMEVFQGTTDFYIDGETAVTLGKFDGVHLGHQTLISRIKSLESQGARSVVFALNARAGALLLTPREQRDAVERMGVSCLIQCPFVPEISGMHPEAFVEQILVKRLHAKYVVVGRDFRFGFQREGNAALLEEMGKTHGFTAQVMEKKKYGEREISSTYVREALEEGEMELVRELLGRPFEIEGVVMHGRQIGRTLGMPTVNLVPPKEKLLPPCGVYASKTWIDGTFYPGVTNIGYKPTVDGSFRGVETYLFDVDRDLYGKNIVTQLYSFRRPEQKFSSLEELKNQMHRDISFGKEYFRG